MKNKVFKIFNDVGNLLGVMPIEKVTNKNIIFEDDGIYINKDGSVFPISHPDISTQPSLLPQKFGSYKMYEVLSRADYSDFSQNNLKVLGSLITELVSSTQIYSSAAVSITNNFLVVRGSTNYLVKDIYISDGKLALSHNVDFTQVFFNDLSINLGIAPFSVGNCLNVITLDGNFSSYNLPALLDVPNDAEVISATAFSNQGYSQPIKVVKFRGKWCIGQFLDFRPDFVLCQYYMKSEAYYYAAPSGGDDRQVYIQFPMKDGHILHSEPLSSVRLYNYDLIEPNDIFVSKDSYLHLLQITETLISYAYLVGSSVAGETLRFNPGGFIDVEGSSEISISEFFSFKEVDIEQVDYNVSTSGGKLIFRK